MSELETLRRWLADFRAAVERKTADLDAEQLARRAVPPSTLSLLGLVRHLAQMEHHWFRRVLQQHPEETQLFVVNGDWESQFDGAVADAAVVDEAFATWRDDRRAGRRLARRAARRSPRLRARPRRPDRDHPRRDGAGAPGVRAPPRPRRPAPREHRRADRPVASRRTGLGCLPVSATTAWGFGLATLDATGTVLDVWFPSPALGEKPGDAVPPAELSALQGTRQGPQRHPRAAARRDRRPPGRAGDHRGRVAAAAPAVAAAGRAALDLAGRRVRAAHQRRVDQRRAVRGRRLRVDPGAAARRTAGTSRSSASTSSRGWSTTCCRPASGSPTPTGSGSARTWPRARP